MYIYDIILIFIGSIILMVCVLVSVAFLTLLERKILGYIQLRKGPNKVGFMGIFQPFSDAVKLFTKEQTYPVVSNFFSYFFSPVFSLYLSLLSWMVMPMIIKLYSFNLGIMFFLSCLSLSVYTIMVAGWSSNSNYALLGGLRAVAQTISYEVSLVLILLSLIFLIMSYNLLFFNYYQYMYWFIYMFVPIGMIWLVICLAETNRTPFDLAEGESELVSGFNIEYSSGGFALIFLAEYSSILFMSMLYVMFFGGGNIFNFMFYLKLMLISSLFIWVRGTLPRFRYDKLMYLTWKCFLSFSLNSLIFFLSFKLVLMFLIFL